jgi:hypothetical protein
VIADGQAAADLGALAGGVGVFLDQITREEPGEIGDAAGVAAGAPSWTDRPQMTKQFQW